MTEQLNFKDEKLNVSHEFRFIYSGPSFEKGIKINMLIENLKSIKELIYTITDVNSEYKKGYNSSRDIKEIKIIPRKGSIEEQIIILFSNPEVRSAVISMIISLFFYLLSKHDAKRSEQEIKDSIERIEDLVIRDQLKNVKKLYEPLEQDKDTLKIVENNLVKFEVNFFQKKEIDKSIIEIESNIKIEETNEEFEGYISAIDIDTKRLKFHPKIMEKSYPLEFNQPIITIAPLIGRVIHAKMKVFKYKDKIKRFQLLKYRIVQHDLHDFKE